MQAPMNSRTLRILENTYNTWRFLDQFLLLRLRLCKSMLDLLETPYVLIELFPQATFGGEEAEVTGAVHCDYEC